MSSCLVWIVKYGLIHVAEIDASDMNITSWLATVYMSFIMIRKQAGTMAFHWLVAFVFCSVTLCCTFLSRLNLPYLHVVNDQETTCTRDCDVSATCYVSILFLWWYYMVFVSGLNLPPTGCCLCWCNLEGIVKEINYPCISLFAVVTVNPGRVVPELENMWSLNQQ